MPPLVGLIHILHGLGRLFKAFEYGFRHQVRKLFPARKRSTIYILLMGKDFYFPIHNHFLQRIAFWEITGKSGSHIDEHVIHLFSSFQSVSHFDFPNHIGKTSTDSRNETRFVIFVYPDYFEPFCYTYSSNFVDLLLYGDGCKFVFLTATPRIDENGFLVCHSSIIK